MTFSFFCSLTLVARSRHRPKRGPQSEFPGIDKESAGSVSSTGEINQHELVDSIGCRFPLSFLVFGVLHIKMLQTTSTQHTYEVPDGPKNSSAGFPSVCPGYAAGRPGEDLSRFR